MPSRNPKRRNATSNPTPNPNPRRKSSWFSLPSPSPLFPTNTLNKLVILCAGRDAKYLFIRKQTMAIWCRQKTITTNNPEEWAAVVGGSVTGEREAVRSNVKPWEEPNFGITFRYRESPETTTSSAHSSYYESDATLTSCGTNSTIGSTLVSFPSLDEQTPGNHAPTQARKEVHDPKVPLHQSTNQHEDEDDTLRKSDSGVCASSTPEYHTLDAFKPTRTPLAPGEVPFVPEPSFSEDWNLPTERIITNRPNDPAMQLWLRENGIKAILRPDLLTLPRTTPGSSTKEAMEAFISRPSCKIASQFLSPTTKQQGFTRMPEQSQAQAQAQAQSKIPQPQQRKNSQAKTASHRRNSSDKNKINTAAKQEAMARRANEAYEAKQNAARKRAPPAMERTSKRRAPNPAAAMPVSILKPSPKRSAQSATAATIAEGCDDWDPSWIVESAR